MEVIKIIEDKVNELLERREVKVEVLENLKREEVRKMVAENLKENENLTVVVKLQPVFGEKKYIGRIHIYKSEEQMRKIEPKYLLKRNGLVKENEKKEGNQ